MCEFKTITFCLDMVIENILATNVLLPVCEKKNTKEGVHTAVLVKPELLLCTAASEFHHEVVVSV